jgi:glycerophosphoryl diester phosphodiesterase
MPPPPPPQILAHRGALLDAPENTVPAVVRALELGVDGIEIDVQVSRDDQLVVIHDERLDRTTNGTGLVAALTASELAQLDAGGWFDPRYQGVGVPMLRDVFDVVGGRCRINVEVKDWGGTGDHAAGLLAGLLDDHEAHQHVIVSSFAWTVLRRLRAIDARIALGALHINPLSARQEHELLASDLRVDAVHPSGDAVTVHTMQWARQHGISVNAWTVNEVDAARRLHDLGVDAIITDDPRLLLAALAPSTVAAVGQQQAPRLGHI